MKIKKIIHSEFEGENTDSVTLTMTCSKRLHLFKKTLPSFIQYCNDLVFVSKVLIFDDSSTPEDRNEMERIAESLFPKTNIDFVYFNDIPTKYRHAYIMQHWLRMIKTNFVFHLEDDRVLVDNFSLSDSIKVIKDDLKIFSVGFSQTLREFPEEYLAEYRNAESGKNKEIIYSKNPNYWVWPYVDSKEIGAVMFYDTVRSHEGSEELKCNYWEMFINYPPFGLQPSVMDVNKLRSIGNFELVDKLEGSYGLRLYKHFDALCTLKNKQLHVGSTYHNEVSAYEMNESNR